MMRNESILVIESDLKDVVKQVEAEIMQSFPYLLSYDLLTGRKQKLTHDFDPPWDYSGTLISTPGNTSYNVADYEKVGDFLQEYTGNTIASYISNYGLLHETYEEKHSKWGEDKFRDAHYDYFNKLGKETLETLIVDILGKSYLDYDGDEHEEDLNDLTEILITYVDEFEDLSFSYAESLYSKIMDMDLLLVYKLGEPEAKEDIHRQRVECERAEKLMREEEEAFYKWWPLLEKKYKLSFQKPFPKRIEMPDFESFAHFLDQHQVSIKERALIAKHAPISFSNSVSYKLKGKY